MPSGCPCGGSGPRRSTRSPVSPRTALRCSWTGSPFRVWPGSASTERPPTESGTSGEVVVDEVPGPELSRLQADKKIIGRAVSVCRARLGAKVTRRDSPHRLLGALCDELDLAANLDSAVGRGVLA